ncbi:MAG: hypothetical protein ACUVTO_02535 [Candidatus Caldatribacteriaceae bacterium]
MLRLPPQLEETRVTELGDQASVSQAETGTEAAAKPGAADPGGGRLECTDPYELAKLVKRILDEKMRRPVCFKVRDKYSELGDTLWLCQTEAQAREKLDAGELALMVAEFRHLAFRALEDPAGVPLLIEAKRTFGGVHAILRGGGFKCLSLSR